ncbi:clavaminate synthase-like protein [Lichtheimia corymbifera JMRC:FSU:9682]|uniref:JmjC domain-containing histone demethylation protein 1 n=1 Tax=Lichtheimia corymbifera JMRC:FSU:9682 TaxID=1263082 RepID=A0A068S7J2_9FUNG|nr:clavaminate synthase-like protein [Lichtheimia corymbifera JMRC:FSU:9682]
MENSSEKCRYCSSQTASSSSNVWIRCDACNEWCHAQCVGLDSKECDRIEQYHCPQCLRRHGPSTYKPNVRKSQRERARLNYADLNNGKTADQEIWKRILNAQTFAKDPFKRYQGSQVTLELIRETGMREPFVIESPEGLDMQMPSQAITVNDIADAIGHDHPVEVMDVATQSEVPNWTMGQWAKYYNDQDKDRTRNVISLEISDTKLAESIVRPRIVRELDWIDQVWPSSLKPNEYPKVQLYCLMGIKDSYTDFHVDFGGSSVFYHVVKGSKVFYFIEPTTTNLRKYQKWSSSPDQSTTFFADEVKKCYAVHIKQGNTMIIPTGWIHAVYTPEDSLVIGGNFLHAMNIGAQLRVYDVEDATKVPAKFRFPFYKRMNWYAARYYHDLLLQDQGTKSVLSKYELEGLNSLAQWLKKDIQSGSRKDIPHDIHDPSALLSQLISMVENEMEKQQIPKRKRSDSTDSLGNETDDHVKREGDDDDDDDLVREKLETASLAKRRKSIGKEQTGAS